jgi:riboflavin biosynthesis pyrimidine reductase
VERVHRLVQGPEIDDVLAVYEAVDRRRTDGRPWVVANMVAGIDGTTAHGGRVGPLSGPADASLFRSLRAVADVVLVGAGTVRQERYGPVRLTEEQQASRAAAGRVPLPSVAIVSGSLDLDWELPVFTGSRPIVLTGADVDPDRLADARRHADVVASGHGRLDPAAIVDELGALGHAVVLCEGGPTLLGELAAVDRVDELCLTVSPVMGGDPLPVAVFPPGTPTRRYRLAHTLQSGDEVFLRYEREDQ